MKIPFKKIILLTLAVLSFYIFLDYYKFTKSRPQGEKTLLIISHNILPNSIKESLIKQIRASAQNNPNIALGMVNSSDYHLPFIQAESAPLEQPITTENVQAWNNAIAKADGIIYIIPEYNNGYPGYVKNEVDLLWKAWHNKAIGVIGYSVSGEHEMPFTQAVSDVFNAVKSDLVPMIYISNADKQFETSTLINEDLIKKIDTMVAQVYATISQPSYFKQKYRAIGDKLKRKMIKFFKPKK